MNVNVHTKLAAVLTGTVTLTLALAGCGDSGSSKVDAYAKTVCDQVQPQLQKIQSANDSIASVSTGDHSPQQVKTTDAAAFQDISNAYRALAQAVDKAGPPPVNDGATIQQDAVKELDATAKAYSDLKRTVDGLNTGDRAKFADGLKNVAEQLSSVSRSGGDALNKLQSGDVGRAMAEQPGCRPPAATASAPSGQPGSLPSAARSASPSPSATRSASAGLSSSPSA